MRSQLKILPQHLYFQWDAGNTNKNWVKHRVTNEECEEVFFDPHKRILKDTLHYKKEERFLLLGRTAKGRALFVVFTLRKTMIRVISARDLNRKEYRLL